MPLAQLGMKTSGDQSRSKSASRIFSNIFAGAVFVVAYIVANSGGHRSGSPDDAPKAQPGLAQVSGFYGPGTWAAWILGMTTSLGIIFRCLDSRATASLILPIVYTNWAAIDQRKQFKAPNVSLERQSSATGITLGGIWFMQIVLLRLRTCVNVAAAAHINSMGAMVLSGSVLPFIATTMTALHIYITKWDHSAPEIDEQGGTESTRKHSEDSTLSRMSAWLYIVPFWLFAYLQLRIAWQLMRHRQFNSAYIPSAPAINLPVTIAATDMAPRPPAYLPSLPTINIPIVITALEDKAFIMDMDNKIVTEDVIHGYFFRRRQVDETIPSPLTYLPRLPVTKTWMAVVTADNGYIIQNRIMGIATSKTDSQLHQPALGFLIAMIFQSLNHWKGIQTKFAKQHGIEEFQVCLLKPCSPQSITESDQGFSLCCALLQIAYEFGPQAVSTMRPAATAAVEFAKTVPMVIAGVDAVVASTRAVIAVVTTAVDIVVGIKRAVSKVMTTVVNAVVEFTRPVTAVLKVAVGPTREALKVAGKWAIQAFGLLKIWICCLFGDDPREQLPI